MRRGNRKHSHSEGVWTRGRRKVSPPLVAAQERCRCVALIVTCCGVAPIEDYENSRFFCFKNCKPTRSTHRAYLCASLSSSPRVRPLRPRAASAASALSAREQQPPEREGERKCAPPTGSYEESTKDCPTDRPKLSPKGPTPSRAGEQVGGRK